MKNKLQILLFCLITLAFPNFAEEGAQPLDRDKISETLGHLIVRQLNNPDLEFNFDKVILGMQNERAGKPSPMNQEEYEQAIASIQEGLFRQTAENNLAQANAFLEKNASEANVKAIDEKLQYQIIATGLGEEVGPESIPLIHYQGKLLDGTVFASSKETGNPIPLPIKQTIPGFAKGLVGMKEGEKRTLYIHPELAYGISGLLPPNSLLIFEVEIVKADSQKSENPVDEEANTALRS